MKKSIFFILLSMLPSICMAQYSSADTTFYPNGQIYEITAKLVGDSITIRKRFYSQHKKFENGMFVLGEKKEDRIEAIETYTNAGKIGYMQAGYCEYFFENGQKKFEVIYAKKNGDRYINQWKENSDQILKSGNGIYLEFEHTGFNGWDSLVYEVKDSLLHGQCRRYRKNDMQEYYLRSVQNFENNRPIGIRKTYGPNNKLLFTEEFFDRPDSIFYQSFYENGNVKESGIELNDESNGIWIYFSENGIKEKEIEYHRSYWNGVYREFHSNGIVKEEGNYILIMQEDEVSRFNAETFEETISIEKVETSVKNGVWIYKNKEGNIEKKEYFKNGKLKKKTSVKRG